MSRESGSATVAAIALLGVVVVAAAMLAAVTGTLADRAAAHSTADLAALAGAHAVRHAPGRSGAGCDTAREAAQVNGARTVRCVEFADGSVQVTVKLGRATASARAGPAWAGPHREGPGSGSG